MNATAPLAEMFLPHLGEAQRAAFVRAGGTEVTLAAVLSLARESWPQLALAAEEFLPFLARRLPPGLVAAEEMCELEIGDLYLLCAYGRGETRAVLALQTKYMLRVEAGLARLGAKRPMIEDIGQMLHQRLLSADRLDVGSLRYNGKGPLVRWLYLAASRAALDIWRKDRRRARIVDEDLERVVLGEDHEVAYLKLRHRAEFQAAFQAAFATLTSRDRNVLRYHVLDQLNVEQIGSIYRVHRATVARWIAAVRQQLLVKTRAAMRATLKADHATFESVIRLIESELEVSLRRLLETSLAEQGPRSDPSGGPGSRARSQPK